MPAQRSTGTKVLLGCSIGCGVLILLVIGCGVGLFVWASGRRPVVDPSQIIPQACDGFAVVRVSPQDKGLQQVFIQVLMAQQKASGQPVNRKLQELKAGGPKVEKQLASFLPANLVVVAKYDEKEKETKVSGVFSFAGYWRLFRWFINKMVDAAGQQAAKGGQGATESYKGIKFGQLSQTGETAWVGMYLNNLIVGQNVDDAKVLLDRLQSPGEVKFDPEIQQLLDQVDGKQDIVYVLSNRHGAVEKVLDRLFEKEEQPAPGAPEKPAAKEPPPFDPKLVSGLAGHVDLVSSDVLTMRLVLRAKSAADAGQLAAGLEKLKAKVKKENPDVTRFDIKQSAADVTIEVEVTGLEQKIDNYFQQQARQAPGRGALPMPAPAPGQRAPQVPGPLKTVPQPEPEKEEAAP